MISYIILARIKNLALVFNTWTLESNCAVWIPEFLLRKPISCFNLVIFLCFMCKKWTTPQRIATNDFIRVEHWQCLIDSNYPTNIS